jgi:hypothetical protein
MARQEKPRVARVRFDDDGKIVIEDKQLRDLVRGELRKGDCYLFLDKAPFVIEKAICGFPPPGTNIICPCDPGQILKLRFRPKPRHHP